MNATWNMMQHATINHHDDDCPVIRNRSVFRKESDFNNRLLPEHSCLILFIWPTVAYHVTVASYFVSCAQREGYINQCFYNNKLNLFQSILHIVEGDEQWLTTATYLPCVLPTVVQQFYKSSLQHIPMTFQLSLQLTQLQKQNVWHSWRQSLTACSNLDSSSSSFIIRVRNDTRHRK